MQAQLLGGRVPGCVPLSLNSPVGSRQASRAPRQQRVVCRAEGQEGEEELDKGQFVRDASNKKVKDFMEGVVPDEGQADVGADELSEEQLEGAVVREEELMVAGDMGPGFPAVQRMSAAQVYESELWDSEAARSMRPLTEDERPFWMTEQGEYDLWKLNEHLHHKYWTREDRTEFTRGESALKCGDEVQIVYTVWEKVIDPTNNSWRQGQFRQRIGRWQGVISKIESFGSTTVVPDCKMQIHVKAFYAGVPINKTFYVHHPNIQSIKVVGFEPDWDAKWNDLSLIKYSGLCVR